MALAYKLLSILIMAITILWLLLAFQDRELIRWQFLTAGAIHFIAAVIINRQYVKSSINYLGVAHIIATVMFFGYGYIFL